MVVKNSKPVDILDSFLFSPFSLFLPTSFFSFFLLQERRRRRRKRMKRTRDPREKGRRRRENQII
jgi:hypothetical protein